MNEEGHIDVDHLKSGTIDEVNDLKKRRILSDGIDIFAKNLAKRQETIAVMKLAEQKRKFHGADYGNNLPDMAEILGQVGMEPSERYQNDGYEKEYLEKKYKDVYRDNNGTLESKNHIDEKHATIASEIEHMHDLLERGIITEEEFEKYKKSVLGL